MDKNRLTQEELLQELTVCVKEFSTYPSILSQSTYNQLKEIVGWYFAYEKAKKGFLQQRSTVTKKWVESFLPERIDYAGSLKAGIVKMLEELGIEVADK